MFERWRRNAAPERPVDPWAEILALLFPNGLDDVQHHLVRYAIGDSPPTLAAARVALGALDQQTSASPVMIRWGPDDLDVVDVEGVKIALDRADASVSVQIAEGSYEPHVAATLDRLLGAGDVFVDVGANVGYHSFRASPRVGADGRVIAVEANPENARLIAWSIAINSLTNVELVPLALASCRGYVNFGTHVGSNGGFLPDDDDTTGSGRGTIVPTIAIDDLGSTTCRSSRSTSRAPRPRDRRVRGDHRARSTVVRHGVLAGDDRSGVARGTRTSISIGSSTGATRSPSSIGSRLSPMPDVVGRRAACRLGRLPAHRGSAPHAARTLGRPRLDLATDPTGQTSARSRASARVFQPSTAHLMRTGNLTTPCSASRSPIGTSSSPGCAS